MNLQILHAIARPISTHKEVDVGVLASTSLHLTPQGLR